MDEKKFGEMIQFAIQREIESMDFYDRASKGVKHSGTRDLFSDFVKQEEGHKKKLEAVRVGKIELGKIEKIPNLKISDYMVEAELKPDISYAEILRIAMKREERSVKLYTDLNEKNQDETLRSLFTFLIQEESKHKYYIEKLYDDEVLK
ncbi:MAG TPA: ferritin family protein [Thermodesulfobacteriota bacterium]|nr:ferritin family protein [Thermodesulfobacteriota bacterium]